MTKLTHLLKQVLLKEDESMLVNHRKMKMRLKPNINPTKQGIRIQFALDNAQGDLGVSEKQDLTNTLQRVLNKALSQYGMSVNEDPDVPNQAESVIGFYLTVEALEAFVTDAVNQVLKTLSPQSKTDDSDGEESDKDDQENEKA